VQPTWAKSVDVLREPRDAVDGLIVFRQLGVTGSRQKAYYSKTAQKLHLPLPFSEIPMQVGHKMKKLRGRQFFDTQEFIEVTQRRKWPLQNELELHG
jgi:hypothetical protein